MNNGVWKYDHQMGQKPYLGFVYIVHDKWAKRYYIGKKSYKVKRGLKKGEESDWRYYKTSCKELKDHMAIRPAAEFDFIVLGECTTLGGLAWAETFLQTLSCVPLSSEFYNTRIESITFKVNEEVNKIVVKNWNSFWKAIGKHEHLLIWER
jgi:hypothetical protein